MATRVSFIVGLWCAMFCASALARHWADTTGQFAVEAELIEVRGENVVLKKQDGTLAAVPINRLGADDQRFVASWSKNHQPASAPSLKPQRSPVTAGQSAIEAALAKSAKYKFRKSPLAAALHSLSGSYSVEIYLDLVGLQQAGIAPDLPVTATGTGSLAEALGRLLTPHELVWTTHYDVIYVTTSKRAAEFLETKVYRFTQPNADFDSSIEDIVTHIARGSWAENGGSGGIAPWPAGALVITQTDQNHRLIEQRYSATMRPVVRPKPSDKVAKGHDRQKGPWDMLEQPVDLDFADAPLSDVAESISKQCKAKISLDVAGLKSAGLSSSTPVTLHVHGARLKCALSLALEPLGGGWTGDEGKLRITSAKVAAATMTGTRHTVRDLVSDNRAQALIEMITDTIDGPSWEDSGGPGTISVVGDVLKVRQSFAVQRQIDELLEDLRQVGAGR